MHGPTLHAEARYTFFLPHSSLLDAVRVGDLVKLGFDYEPAGKKYSGERMWVDVQEIDGSTYVGHLVNQPNEPSTTLEYGDRVSFERENVLDVLLVDQSRLPNIEPDENRHPRVPERREYWDRCLVDECVLDGVPVEYIYREEPELAGPDDTYLDSGWRIRGRETDDMDERKVAYVALGGVLNEDDSWLALIDAPVGSAFMRNFDTGSYEAAP
jgi:hypothetical protein